MSSVVDARRLHLCLCALWGTQFQLRFAPRGELVRSCFSERTVLLPRSEGSGFSPLDVARATHAALHAQLSPLPFEPGQLRPIQRAVIGVLEDARVEARALAEFSGLRAVWKPFHVASPADGETAPALLGRLARALFDSEYADPNGWIQRARAAWDVADHRDAASSRALGSVLGNDLGQMRVPFDPAAPTLEPSYRDDHAGLWRSEPRIAHETEERADGARREGSSGAGSGKEPDVGAPPPVTHRYPEWDYVIARERPEHCAIRELGRASTSGTTVPAGVARRTRDALSRAHRRCSLWRRSREGAELDLSAVVTEAAERARGGGGDERLYRGRRHRRTRSSTLLLLDLSASVQERELALLQGISTLLAGSHPEGTELAVHGFSSRGREDVLYEKFKAFDAPPTPLAPNPGRSGSTRLGAALRHAARLLKERRAPLRLLLVVTDGEPSDVDVFDARYLTEDARRACAEARRRGARVLALCLGARLEGSQRRIFDAPGIRGALAVRRLEDLPRSVLRAYSPWRSSPGDGSRV